MLFQVNKKQEEPTDTLHSFFSLTLRLNLNNKSIFRSTASCGQTSNTFVTIKRSNPNIALHKHSAFTASRIATNYLEVDGSLYHYVIIYVMPFKHSMFKRRRI